MQYVLFVSDPHETISILQTACFCSVSKLRNIVARDVFLPLKQKVEVYSSDMMCYFPPREENNYTENLSWNRTN